MLQQICKKNSFILSTAQGLSLVWDPELHIVKGRVPESME